MLHGHVPANTRNTWARFQALWLWASHLTLGVSVPLAGKEASLAFLASLASPGMLGLWEVRMGCPPTALPQQAVSSRVRWVLVFRNPVPCSQVQACFLQGQVQEASSE